MLDNKRFTQLSMLLVCLEIALLSVLFVPMNRAVQLAVLVVTVMIAFGFSLYLLVSGVKNNKNRRHVEGS